MPNKKEIATRFKELQLQICTALENCDGKASFKQDAWERPGGGGGLSRIIEKGAIFEKGGVNFSEVYGELNSAMVKSLELTSDKATFFATGVSIFFHPQKPHIPIIHMNIRYFEIAGKAQWFGGGIDLTPIYIDAAECKQFHMQLKSVCEQHEPGSYARYKQWADDYFYIPHRTETRGIGGIFFDRLTETPTISIDKRFDFVDAVGRLFTELYLPMIELKRQRPFTEEQKKWQLLRRGRYVEFNLLYDRGTKFGLETDGRVESILMSLPPMVCWQYNVQVEPGTEEFNTQQLLKKGIDWA